MHSNKLATCTGEHLKAQFRTNHLLEPLLMFFN
jgi:hypothetical protein